MDEKVDQRLSTGSLRTMMAERAAEALRRDRLLAAIALFAGLALRPVKATMVALQYRFRDVERDVTGQE